MSSKKSSNQGAVKSVVRDVGKLLFSWKSLVLDLMQRVDGIASLVATIDSVENHASYLREQAADSSNQTFPSSLSYFECAFPNVAPLMAAKVRTDLQSAVSLTTKTLSMMQDVTVALEFQYDKARTLLTGHEPALDEGDDIFGPDHLFHIQSLCSQILREYHRKKSLLDPFLLSLSRRGETKSGDDGKEKEEGGEGGGGRGGVLEGAALSDFSPDSCVSSDSVDSFVLVNNLSE